MKKIKLENYKEEMVCYFDDLWNFVVVEADDRMEIEELVKKGYTIYGTIAKKVFTESLVDDFRDMCKDHADDYGYDEMNEFIDYKSDKFKKIATSINEWIESLGNTNEVYYADKDIIIVI